MTGATQTDRHRAAPGVRERDRDGGNPASFDPGRLMRDVDEGANRLELAAEKLHDATLRFETAEEAYDAAMAKLRLQADLVHSGQHDGKLPSQDRRQDVALTSLQRDNTEVYVEYFAAKAEHEALSVRYRALAAAVSARQSLLRVIGGAGG